MKLKNESMGRYGKKLCTRTHFPRFFKAAESRWWRWFDPEPEKKITKNKKIRLAWKRHDDADDMKLKSLEEN